jgi:transposase
VLPKRWVVEPALAWLNRCRRLAKDWECLNRRARGFLLCWLRQADGAQAVPEHEMITDSLVDETGFSFM